MIFDATKNKAVQDHSFRLIKLSIDKASSYETLLQACTGTVWPNDVTENAEFKFYMADGGGVSIGDKELTVYSNGNTDTPLDT